MEVENKPFKSKWGCNGHHKYLPWKITPLRGEHRKCKACGIVERRSDDGEVTRTYL